MIIIGLCSRELLYAGSHSWHRRCPVSMWPELPGTISRSFKPTLRADIGPWGNPPDAVLYYVAGAGEVVPQGTTTTLRELPLPGAASKGAPNSLSTLLQTARPAPRFSVLDGVDKAFQLMIQWQGRMGIRQLKFFYDRQLQSPLGVCPTDGEHNPLTSPWRPPHEAKIP